MITSIILNKLKDSFTDLLPIILVIAFFQIIVLKRPLPQMGEVIFGALLVVAGLSQLGLLCLHSIEFFSTGNSYRSKINGEKTINGQQDR